MQYKHSLDYFILNNLEEEEERLALGNMLNRLWDWDIEQYQELVSSAPTIDFTKKDHILRACKCFAIIRYVGLYRQFELQFHEIYFDKRLHVTPAWFSETDSSQSKARLFVCACQPFYDYNLFYDTHSLHIM